MGHKVGSSSIANLLETVQYRRHFDRETKEGSNHPDRDARFDDIKAKAQAFQAATQPVISVDTKTNERIGAYKNGGGDHGPMGKPIEVNVHDFEDKALGKLVPYGIYDVGANQGSVSLGIDHDTGQFAVDSVRRWLDRIGLDAIPRRPIR